MVPSNVGRHAHLVMTPRARSTLLALAMLLAWGLGGYATPPPAIGAGITLYVDGKHGRDSDTGRSWDRAFRTINRAARELPRDSHAAGWTVVVRGYSDYVYRGRPVPGAYDRAGTASNPVIFTAEGWAPGATNYVKPIVSGALVAPKAGRSWQDDSTSDVWWTAWDAAPAGFDRSKPYSSAVFQNRIGFLWQHASLADLRNRASRGDGGYWWDSGAHRLYISTRRGVAPSSVTIDVPNYMGFYFTGSAGSRYISVRGFVVQHTSMGITFHLGADHNSAYDNIGVANVPMSFGTSGRTTNSGFDPAVANVFLRNSASYSTLQGFKVDAGSQDTVICHNTVRHNALQGIKVQGPPTASDPRVTSGTEVCQNVLADQDTQRPGPGRADERPNGLTLCNGARGTYVHHNTIRSNVVGVQVNQGGIGSPITNTRFQRNLVYGNRSVGLSLRDGVADRRSGTGSLHASFNLYWDNEIGIRVHSGSTNKTFEHETVYENRTSGFVIGCDCASARTEVAVSEGLVTHNGAYGIWIAPGQDVRLRYLGISSNKSGAVLGSASKTRVNTRAAGYLSRDPATGDFLKIGPSSFQYTAGVDGKPIGARY
jgi:hypothetical protein